MIRLRDATTLAITKLQTHRIRLAIAMIVSSLLLAILGAGLNVSAGFFEGLNRFSHEGLSNRYLVSISSSPLTSYSDPSPELVKRITEIRTQHIAEKTAKAKSLGVTYDPKLEPAIMSPYSSDKYPMLNYQSEAVRQAVDEPYIQTPFTHSMLLELAKKYDATHIYSPEIFRPIADSSMVQMVDGKERFGEDPNPSSSADSFPFDVVVLPSSLTKPFETVSSPSRGPSAVPIVVPYSYVEKALGFKKLPGNAPSSEKLARIKEVRQRAGEVYPVACYRNSASRSNIEQALTALKEEQANKDNREYQKPDLIYGLPGADTCGAAVVKRDARSAAEKQQEQKLLQVNESAYESTEPLQQKIVFRVVGIVPDDARYAQGLTTIESFAAQVVGSHLSNMWVVPDDKAAQLGFPVTPYKPTDPLDNTMQIFEFASADAAKKFADGARCPIANCDKPKREIVMMQFGNNSVFIAQAREMITKSLLSVGGVVVAISAVILMAIVGRMIADGRRETAVFRAIGAKRSDISLIYAVYTFFVSLGIGLVGTLGGLAIAVTIDAEYGREATAQALLSFGSTDPTRIFPLIAVHWQDILIVVGLALVAGIIGMILPLLRNVRRNPINDMRDE